METDIWITLKYIHKNSQTIKLFLQGIPLEALAG